MSKPPLRALKYVAIGAGLVASAVGVTFAIAAYRSVPRVPALRVNPRALYSEIMVRSWRMVGPFPVGGEQLKTAGHNNGAAGLDRDYLAAFGFREDLIGPSEFARLGASPVPAAIRNIQVNSEGELIEPTEYFDFGEYGIAYAAAQIESASEAELAMPCSNTHGMKLWLNHVNILTTGYSTGAQKFQHVLRVRLKKGRNFLLVKKTAIKGTPVGYGYPAAFSVGLSSIAHAKEMQKVVCQEMIANSMNGYWPDGRNVLAPGDELRVTLPLYAKERAQIDVRDSTDRTVMSHEEPSFAGRWSRRLATMPEGLYRVRVGFPSDELLDSFYFGDLDKLLARLKRRSLRFLANETSSMNLSGLLTRLETLIDFRKRGEPSMFQDPNIVYVIGELETTLGDLENGVEAYGGKPGTHIRGFRSKIDGQVRHYMVHAPAGDAQTSRPLVIVVPFTSEPHPFLRSIIVAQRQYAMMNARLADQAGFLVLWPHARGLVGTGSPIAMADIFEALEAVKKDYRVDEERIYLSGFCSGGRGALLLAARYPSLFAAVAAWGPNRSRPKNELQQRWFDANQPYALLESLFNIPLYVIQGKFDTDPPVEESREFIENARAAGLKVEYNETSDGTHIYFAVHPLPEFFKFFRGKSRAQSPSEVRVVTGQLKYNEAQWLRITALREPMMAGSLRAVVQPAGTVRVATKNVSAYELVSSKLPVAAGRNPTVWTDSRLTAAAAKGDTVAVTLEPEASGEPTLRKSHSLEGPISDAFADHFVVVYGSGGASAEQQAIRGVAKRLRSTWQELFHGDPPVKADTEVTQADIERSHLILIGGGGLNSVAARVVGKVPAQLDRQGAAIGDRIYPGRGLGLQIVYPNPLNPRKYIVLLAGADAASYRFQNDRIVTTGWYDYVVWRPTVSDKAEIVDIGYFDATWKRLISVIAPGLEQAPSWPWDAGKPLDQGLANF